MNPIAIWISISLHIVILILSYFDFHGFIWKKPIKDTGHIVFDFVTIGNKSKAPVLSTENSRASRKKTHTEGKLDNKIKNQSEHLDVKQLKNEEPTDKKKSDKQHLINKSKGDETPSKENNKLNKIPSKINDKKVNNNQKRQVDKNTNRKQDKKTPIHKIQKKEQKSGTKALENKAVKTKKTQNIKQGEKGAFDSLIDNALADGNYENSGLNAEEVGDTLTATQIDLVRETIRPCWHFPAGLKDADKLIVDIKMELDNNGYVTSAKIADASRLKQDPNFRTAAESALRAVLDPACNPLPLPKDKYNEWKDLELSFNPKDWI